MFLDVDVQNGSEMMISIIRHQSKYGDESFKDQFSILLIIVIQNIKQTVQCVLRMREGERESKYSNAMMMSSPGGT